MSKTLTIEEQSGTFTRNWHPHNVYYAGDFSTVPCRLPATSARSGVHAVSASPAEIGDVSEAPSWAVSEPLSLVLSCRVARSTSRVSGPHHAPQPLRGSCRAPGRTSCVRWSGMIVSSPAR